MSTPSTNRIETGNPIKAKTSLRRRALGIQVARGRRAADRRFVSAKRAPEMVQTLSIEETIARFVDANPAQLYRGGA
jgi:hypothetical protein